MRITILFLFASLSLSPLFAQDKLDIKFGKIEKEDFARTVYDVDSNASAVVIADIGTTQIVGNTKGWFSWEHKRFKRVHILNKNGYGVADVTIPLYTSGKAEEELDNIKARTYNLENGKIVETKLEKSGIFKDKRSQNLMIKKFTFPNIKEGSIIEFEYKVTSDFLFNFQPWEFQGEYPQLWSEYTVSIPEFLSYVFISQGYHPMHKSATKDYQKVFSIIDNEGAGASQNFTLNTGVTDHRWVMKDIPALKEESFTSTVRNHIAKIEFQLAEYRHPLQYKQVMGTWAQLTMELMKDDDFGAQLNIEKGWMKEVVQPVIAGAVDPAQKARNIYNWVRDNFTCNDYSSVYLTGSLKNSLKSRNGSVADINLLLVALLNSADISADPVLLSTKGHGYTYSLYPMIDKFNYVVCRANINGRDIYLDASQQRLGFGKLTPNCYNGHARVVDASATPVELISDSLQERKVTSLFMINGEDGKFHGSLQQLAGYYESLSIRNTIKEKGQDEFFKEIKKHYVAEIELLHPKVDSLNEFDLSVGIKYDLVMQPWSEDIIYFNPMFGEAIKENYFKAASRNYPVEMPFTFDETFIMQIDIPKGYEVDEMPKSMTVKLNEEDHGRFDYLISKTENSIALRSRIRLSRAYYLPDEYLMLREFFNLIVKKHAEQIVFKKKK